MTASVETHGRASLARYDSARYIDLTVTHDTIAILKTETLWRAPDSLGKVYPLITLTTETSSKRRTANNITATRIDTLCVTDENDDIATEKSTVEPSYQARAAPAISGFNRFMRLFGIVFIFTIAAVIVRLYIGHHSHPPERAKQQS